MQGQINYEKISEMKILILGDPLSLIAKGVEPSSCICINVLNGFW